MKVYCASKSKHAPLWLAWQAKGIQVTSNWLAKFDQGRLSDQTGHWNTILADIQGSDAVLFYSEPGEIQKGAIAEFGIGFALGKKLYYVGPIEDSVTLVEHGNVTHYETLEKFFAEVYGTN